MMKRNLQILILFFSLISYAAVGQFRNRPQTTTPPPQVGPVELNYLNPVEYTIGGIDVTGLNVLDKAAVISLTGLRVGDKIKIPGEAITGAIRKLWKHGLVGDVGLEVDHVEGQNVFLLIRLSERPRLADFYFTGISKGRQSTLKEDLKLIKGKIVNDAMIRNAELSVKKHFHKKGFLNTTVKVVPVADTLNRGNVRLRIDVDLKSKVRINEVVFEGNDMISS